MTYLSVGCEPNARFLNAMSNCVPWGGVPFVIFFKGMYKIQVCQMQNNQGLSNNPDYSGYHNNLKDQIIVQSLARLNVKRVVATAASRFIDPCTTNTLPSPPPLKKERESSDERGDQTSVNNQAGFHLFTQKGYGSYGQARRKEVKKTENGRVDADFN